MPLFVWLVAVPFFVAVPMTLRRLSAFWAWPVGHAETWAMLALGLMATASFAWASGMLITGAWSVVDVRREAVVALALSWALIVPSLVLLRRAWRSGHHWPVAAEQFLCSSHLSGVAFWWIAALYEAKFAEVESGVWMTAVACACDVALIALLQAKARGAAEA
jgi:FtsH-binding integral membrane protein